MGGFFTRAINKLQGKHKQPLILMLGLPDAGKSEFIYYLDNTLHSIPLNIVSNRMFEFHLTAKSYKGETFILAAVDVPDLQRHLGFKQFIKEYLNNIDVLIWIIDSNNPLTMDIAHDRFHNILSEMKPSKLNECHILLLANKQDLPNTMDIEQIKDKMNMTRHTLIDDALFHELRYETMLKYLPNDIFEIVVEYIISFMENGPCVKIKPCHFSNLDIAMDSDKNQKILQIICDYLPNYIYTDFMYTASAQYETIGCSATTGIGVSQALDWLYDAHFNKN